MGYTDKKKINVYSSLNDELLQSFDYDDYFGYGGYIEDDLFTKVNFTNYSFNRLLYKLLDQKENFYIKIGYKGD